VGFYRLEYDRDVFSQRPDIGCVGGKLLDKRHRLCGGMYKKDGTLVYEGLPEGYSGGYQHRAVLQQDAFAVDIRCIAVRKELIPVFEEVTGVKYVDTFYGEAGSDERWSGFSREDIARVSISFAEQVHKRGLRVLWDPQVVIKSGY
jgi:hypothetical protein